MKRQHGLDRPRAGEDMPKMPGDFIGPEDEGESPADIMFCLFSGVFESDEEKIERNNRGQRGDVRRAKKLKCRAVPVYCEQLSHDKRNPPHRISRRGSVFTGLPSDPRRAGDEECR